MADYFERRVRQYVKDSEELINGLLEDLNFEEEDVTETDFGSKAELAPKGRSSGGEAPPTIFAIPESEATKDAKKKRVV